MTTVMKTLYQGALPPGSYWTGRVLPSAAAWASVAFGNGTFTAVAGASNKAATSPDGITWTAQTLPSTATNWTVCFGGGKFVAVNGPSAAGATSTDGATWTATTLPANVDWRAVTWGGGMFVAMSTPGTQAASSPDGTTWTSRTLPTAGTWAALGYGNGTFVALATGSANAATSPDGITWTARTMPVSAGWTSVAYGNGVFVAVAASTVYSSPDGITWTARTTGLSVNWRSVIYADDIFIVIPSGYDTGTCSWDGITWHNQQYMPYSVAPWWSLAYGNGTTVAVSQSISAATNTNPSMVLYRAPGKTVVTSVQFASLSASVSGTCWIRLGKTPLVPNVTVTPYSAYEMAQVLETGTAITGMSTQSISAQINGYEQT